MRTIRRLRGTWLLAALALLLGAGPVGVAALQRLTATSPSPATGTAEVIAQGVAPMPAPEVSWRVVVDTADLPADAQAEQRALGFALADRDAVMLDSEASGIQTRLAGGEAAFVPDGLRQQRSSLGAFPAPYYRIALVPSAQAGDAGGDRLPLSGAPLPPPVVVACVALEI